MRHNPERLLRKGDYVYGSFLKPEQVDGYINGVNPGDRSDVLGRFPFSLRSLDDAMESAARGAARWRRTGLMDRAAAIRRFREQLFTYQEPLARLLTREVGKPLWESRQEVASAQRAIDLFLDDGVGLVAPRVVEEISARTDYLPRGIVGIVTPYNLPVQLAVSMSVAAILGGNAVLLKPSKFTPGVGQAIAELWDRCRLPRGVFNLVQGSGGVIGQRLASHPRLDALLYVGGFEGAREVRRATAERPDLPVLFHTGGKGVALVLDDAEIDRTVYETVVGLCLTAGQRHNTTARLIVTDAAYDVILPELVRRLERVRIGYGTDDNVLMGPLVSENFRTRYRRYARTVLARGHTPLLEADNVEVPHRRGNYVRPGVYEIDWRARNPFLNEEPPGPLLLVYRVSSWEEGCALHNQAAYRLAASVFTRIDNPELGEIRDTLRTGALNVNRGTIGTSLRLPSLGLGRSSNGIPGGIELMRVVTYPRASLVETRPFDDTNLVPGVNWHDHAPPDLPDLPAHDLLPDDDADTDGGLELAVE